MTENDKILQMIEENRAFSREVVAPILEQHKKMNELMKDPLYESLNRSLPIGSLINKPKKSLLALLEKNSRRLAKGGDNLNLIDEQIKIGVAISLQAIKNG